MSDPKILNALINCIKNNIKDKKVDTSSCFKIITLSIEIIDKYKHLNGNEKKQYIINAIETIAKGNDNILGNEDDIIDEAMLLSLNFIINNNYISEFIDIIFKASKGEININKIKKKCCLF
jgi:hypothetical protein